MALKQIVTMALAGSFAMAVATAASAQNTGQGASEFAPGHSTTNIPPGQGGVKGSTWTPPGKAMQADRSTGLKAKASARTKASAKTKVTTTRTKTQIKAKGDVN